LEETSDSFIGSDSVESDGETGQVLAYVKLQIQVTEVLWSPRDTREKAEWRWRKQRLSCGEGRV